MTYDPRQTFKAQQLAFSRAAGTQTSKQQGLSKGAGTPDYSSSAYDSGTGGYDEIALPTESQVDKKISGLGSPSKPDRDDRNLDQKIYDGMKYYGAQFFGMNKTDPRDDDMFLLDAYNSDPMFVIPDPEPVTETGINEGTYDFIDMSQMGGPRQPRTQPNMDTTPQVGGYDEVPSMRDAPGLMAPPVPEVPSTGLDDDEMARIAGETTAPKSDANTYTVTSGDTLSEIARDYGKTVEELVKINGIEDKDKIKVGQKIKLEADFKDPTEAGTTADPVDAAEAAETFTSDNVDFDFIADQEGEAINTAYVPQDDEGNAEGQSGVTIGTGVDLGSKNKAYFEGLNDDIVEKIEPYFGKKRETAQNLLAIAPLELTDAEVADLDRFVKEKELTTLKDKWNEDSDTDFDDLPTNQATAVASVYYQYGQQMFDHNYWDQTTSGDWNTARNNLMNYGDRYNSRRNREATYLASGEM